MALRRVFAFWMLMLVGLALAPVSAYGLQQDTAPPPETQRIGVFGDSLADGLWAGLNGQFRRDPRFEAVDRNSEVSTGMANWVYRDLSVKTADQLSAQQYDIAVVMVGSNDMQGIRDSNGGVHRFRSPSWEAIYRERVDILLTQFEDHGAHVIWVGLPTMRSARYDANVQFLNAIFEEHVLARGGVYVSTREASANAAGEYSGFLPDARGVERMVRSDDGIHFTLPGYRRIAAPVAEAVNEIWRNPPVRYVEPEIDPVTALLLASQCLVEGEPHYCLPPEIVAGLAEGLTLAEALARARASDPEASAQ